MRTGSTRCARNNPVVVQPAPKPERVQGVDGELGVRVMEHYDFTWYAVFAPGDRDARIYATWDDTWRLVAPGVGMFFWDVAQTGLAWWNDTRFQGGRSVVATDVGVALAAASRT